MIKKSILVLTDFFYPHWTGVAKSLEYFIKSTVPEYNVTVLTIQFKKTLKKQESLFGAKVIRAPYIFSVSRAKYSLIILIKAWSLITKNDIVFINSPSSNILFFSIIAKIFGKKLIIFHQGDLILPKGILNKLIEKIFDITTLISCILADKVATYTLDYAENSRILRHFLYKFSPIIFPIPLITPKDVCSKLDLLRNYKKNEYTIFGFAGRFVEEKGFDILFEAIPLIKKQIPKVIFAFAGETAMTYENFFEKNKNKYEKVKSDILMLGLLDNPGLQEFYKIIDAIIVPSRSDCFNLVQAEAMLSGTPSVASNIPGLRFLVQKTGFGAIFQKENPQDLAKKTIEVWENKKNIASTHINVLRFFNIPNNVKKIRNFIE